MEKNCTDKPLNENIHYLNGQIDALTALVLAIANHTMDKDTFRQLGLAHLQAQEDVLLNQAVPEARLAAVVHMKEWVKNQTA